MLLVESTVAPSCLNARICPISEGPCPGECVFADVMRSVNLGILVLDASQSSVIFANSEARSLLESCDERVDYAAVRRLFGGGDKVSGEPDAPHRGSRRLNGQLVGFTTYRNQNIIWTFFRDISNKARLEAVAEAMELANSLGHVFAAVRHEIGNPINSAKMALSVLERNFDSLGREGALDYIREVLCEIDRVSDLLYSLRSFSLYEEVEAKSIDLDRFLEEFVGFAHRDLMHRGIDLMLEIVDSGLQVQADPRALRQVLINLLANAADAMAGKEDAKATLRASRSGDFALLELRDNGPGIPEEVLADLFKPFFTTKEQGTGLGLPIARKMLARMSATVTIENNPGGGASVMISLKRAVE